MSDWDEKVARATSVQREHHPGGRAQASRKQLLARWGSRQVDAGTIEIDSMGRHELWLRVGAGGRKPVAEDVFEQERCT